MCSCAVKKPLTHSPSHPLPLIAKMFCFFSQQVPLCLFSAVFDIIWWWQWWWGIILLYSIMRWSYLRYCCSDANELSKLRHKFYPKIILYCFQLCVAWFRAHADADFNVSFFPIKPELGGGKEVPCLGGWSARLGLDRWTSLRWWEKDVRRKPW